jgi:copper chaperone CopZ
MELPGMLVAPVSDTASASYQQPTEGEMNEGIQERVTFKSPKISGGSDTDRLESELSAVEGVRGVGVNNDAHSVEILYDPTIVDANAIRAAVERAGYPIDPSG